MKISRLAGVAALLAAPPPPPVERLVAWGRLFPPAGGSTMGVTVVVFAHGESVINFCSSLSDHSVYGLAVQKSAAVNSKVISRNEADAARKKNRFLMDFRRSDQAYFGLPVPF